MATTTNKKLERASSSLASRRILWIFSCLASLNIILYQFYNDPLRKRAQLGGEFSSPLLQVPKGTAVALPSIRLSQEDDSKIDRTQYGGIGDKPHLGGFTDLDLMGVSPAVWKFMVENIGVRSVLDVGCGRGVSTSWFAIHGVQTQCVEGSHDAVEKSLIPNVVTEHDFSRGPWWPSQTVDAVWCVEFLEHVGKNFIRNYVPAFRKAAVVFATSSSWGGWHHVEVHRNEWWIQKFELLGFRYSEEMTLEIRNTAAQEKRSRIIAPNGDYYNAQHLWLNMMVFFNPLVATLPEHEHLMAEHGCYENRNKHGIINRKCGIGKFKELEMELPASFLPLELTDAMDKEWVELVQKHVKMKNVTER